MPKIDRILETIERTSSRTITRNNSFIDVGSEKVYFADYLNRYFDVSCLDFSRNILSICPVKNKIQDSGKYTF